MLTCLLLLLLVCLQERLDGAALAYKAERAKMAEQEIIAMEVRQQSLYVCSILLQMSSLKCAVCCFGPPVLCAWTMCCFSGLSWVVVEIIAMEVRQQC
jgi:hypothetical protein